MLAAAFPEDCRYGPDSRAQRNARGIGGGP